MPKRDLFQRPPEVHELPPKEREEGQREAVVSECDAVERRSLRRMARGTLCLDIAASGQVGGRVGPFELLDRLHRALVVAGFGAGKTTLLHVVAAHTARTDLDPSARLPLAAPVALMEQPHLDIAELARLNPAAGEQGVRSAIEDGRAAVFVDGLDQAASPESLKESIAALAEAYPRCAFLVTTRPLPPRIAGVSASAIRGFLSVRFAPPALPATPAYELEARRAPSERVRLLGAEVDRRLRAWADGAILGRMTKDERFMVAAGIALLLHEQRALECRTEGLARALPEKIPLGWSTRKKRLTLLDPIVAAYSPDPDLVPFIEDLRACSGLLVEKRPGILAFADIAFQEYLAAVAHFLDRDLSDELFDRRFDPWWHPVLVCAAGLPPHLPMRLPPATVVRTLLEGDVAADSLVTFLAARVAEVVPDLPSDLRRAIDRRLRAAMPPRTTIQVWHFVDDIGEIAGPALVGALVTAGPNERACIATTLGRIHYPPALRALTRLANDEERTTEPIMCWVWNVNAMLTHCPVAFFAFAAVFNLAVSDPSGGVVFDEIVQRVPLEVFDTFFHLLGSKLAADEYWGNEPPPERDPDRILDMIESIGRARARRGHASVKQPHF